MTMKENNGITIEEVFTGYSHASTLMWIRIVDTGGPHGWVLYTDDGKPIDYAQEVKDDDERVQSE
jgi:hypothetical protein